ncbi:taurine catabolism dioxygenase, partial [Colletotrichum somersetense]
TNLEKKGQLDKRFPYEDVTPTIGREYSQINIVRDLLEAPGADDLLRDLAITISERGVVFFRAQDNLNQDAQKALMQRMGELTGKPATSGLHVHPTMNAAVTGDAEISKIDSRTFKKLYRPDGNAVPAPPWHSDSPFEVDTPGYTSLRLVELPSNGGDTLWASGYDLYDRFSPAYRRFLEGLTVTYVGEAFLQVLRDHSDTVKLVEGPRGSPNNVGQNLTAIHPIVRTNPVTGWKSIYAVGNCVKYVNELTTKESESLLQLLRTTLVENHDLMVRFEWRNKNDIAIWDNRSVFHSGTGDYIGLGERTGVRAVGIHETPYLDPNSMSKTEYL